MHVDNSPASELVFITRKWPPAIGGMETYSVELTRELSNHVQLTNFALAGRRDGSPPTGLALIAFAARTAWKYLRLRGRPRVLHIGDMASWPLGLLALGKRPHALVVLSAHGTDVSFHRRGGVKGRLYGLYLRAGAKLLPAAKVIANSAATAQAAAECGWRVSGIVPLATRVSANAAPVSNHGHLLFAGRLVEQKGCLWFVRNVLPLLPVGMDLKIAGTIRDDSERAVLDHPRVTFLGPLNRAALIDAYRAALCVVVPNIELPSGEFEGFGLVAVEAAAAGGVVLAAATGGLLDSIIDGETGFLLPAAEPEAWRRKIMEIAGWPVECRGAFTDSAMHRARESYDWARVAQSMLDVYREGSGSHA